MEEPGGMAGISRNGLISEESHFFPFSGIQVRRAPLSAASRPGSGRKHPYTADTATAPGRGSPPFPQSSRPADSFPVSVPSAFPGSLAWSHERGQWLGGSWRDTGNLPWEWGAGGSTDASTTGSSFGWGLERTASNSMVPESRKMKALLEEMAVDSPASLHFRERH